MAGQRTLGLNAIRSNPSVIGHNLTGGIDHVLTGEGLTTPFRELKPGTMDAIFDAWSPLRWSVFIEPVHFYRGHKPHIEAVICNEDILLPGEYPARAEIFDAHGKKVYSKKFTVMIDPTDEKEPPFAKLCFSDELTFDFPGGTYRYVVTLEQGGAPAGGETKFYVTERKEMPEVTKSIVVWNDDPDFIRWCTSCGIKVDNSKQIGPDSFIIVTNSMTGRNGRDAAILDKAVRDGATVLFLCPSCFDDNTAGKLFLEGKGTFTRINSWLYQKDEWSKRHPFFHNMPNGGLMDNQYYREIIPDICFVDTVPPKEAVAGAIKASQDYTSGLMLAVYSHGKGKMILSTFLIRETLDVSPAGEFLLKNMIH